MGVPSACLVFMLSISFHVAFGETLCKQTVNIGGNGTVRYPTRIVAGSVLQYICPHGTRPHPVSWRVCLKHGQWSPLQNAYLERAANAVCRPYTCVGYITLENGNFYPRKLRYNVGDTVRFECDDGYMMFGSPNRTCQPNGEWSGSNTVCDDGDSFCPNPGIPLGGQRYGKRFKLFSTVRYTCTRDLVLRGSHVRHCMYNGRWSGQESKCEGRYSSDDPFLIAKKLRFSEEIIAYMQEGIHFYFVLDASGSVGQENFNKAKDFIIDLLYMTSDVIDTVKYGIVVYASNPLVVADLTTKEEAELALDSLEYAQFFNQSGTNTGGALQKVLESIEKKGRDGPKQMILLITDGKYNMGRNPYTVVQTIEKTVANSEEKLDIFTIGIGDADKKDMEQLSSKKEDQRSFYLASYDLLQNITALMRQNTNKDACGIRGAAVPDEEGLGRIYIGQKSEPKQWPWQVLLYMGKDKDYLGGGSLISKRWILTAAHNMFTADDTTYAADEITVYVGGTKNYKNQTSDVPARPVEKVIVHEKYEPVSKQYNYDISLIKLKEELEFDDKVRPICLPCSKEVSDFLTLPQGSWAKKCDYQDQILTGHGGQDGKQISGVIAGWGRTKTRTDGSRNLLHATVDIQDPCYEDIVDHKFCAKGNGTDSCPGDSGGPFMLRMQSRWIQVGLVSHGRRGDSDCSATSMGVYINIPKMMDWIRSKIPEL